MHHPGRVVKYTRQPASSGGLAAVRSAVQYCLLLCLACIGSAVFAAPVNTDEVYTETLRIAHETALIRHSLGITTETQVTPITADLLPRHNLAQSYVILEKVNFFRRQHRLPDASPTVIAPYLDLAPFNTWAETQRILTELAIVKKWLDIPPEPEAIAPVSGKHPIDVFNRLRQISTDWNPLLGGGVLPAHVYSGATRLAEEARILLAHLGIADTTAPPARNKDARPRDSLREVFAVLAEVQRLQEQIGVTPTDFSAFRKPEDVQPDDVLTMTALTLGELQILKAHIGLLQNVTSARSYYPDKQPADVQQVVGYATNRLRLIRTLGR